MLRRSWDEGLLNDGLGDDDSSCYVDVDFMSFSVELSVVRIFLPAATAAVSGHFVPSLLLPNLEVLVRNLKKNDVLDVNCTRGLLVSVRI